MTITIPASPINAPRILCLHGGGSSAEIFKTQCRVLIHHLSTNFRLVFADGPYISTPGPDVVPTYADMAPFRSWLFPGGELGCIDLVYRQLEAAIRRDNDEGWTGEWVGFLGFSQGAKMAASLLLEAQRRNCLISRRLTPLRTQHDKMWCHRWKFAIIVAGRGPLLDVNGGSIASDPDKLFLPSLHVHGLEDPGLPLHRDLYNRCGVPGSKRLMEWDGAHRMPIKGPDVKRLVSEIEALAVSAGVVVR